jgi:ABC-2 type transport system permease protein/sodium transport system permease protein
MTGAVYPAIDLTAGERERGTLEILVAAPIPRMSVLFAKYVAVLTVAMLTALVNLGSMAITLRATGLGPVVFGSGLTMLVFVQVLALLLLFAAFFSAVLLALTSFARSFKEAQAYLIPVMLLALTPGMLALMPGLELSGPLMVAPLINIVLLARDLFEGVATPVTAGVVVATTLLYALAAIALAARIFGTEAVLSSTQSGWSDLLQRPEKQQEVPAPSSALLCLALLFPVYFLLTSELAGLSDLPLGARLGLAALANLVLFGGFPLLFAWMGRVRLSSALRWRVPGWQACCAAVLLGLCLWPFAHELILLLRCLGVATLRDDLLEKIRAVVMEWRNLPPVYIVLVVALVPAVLEELFFRGYLFSALDTNPKRQRGDTDTQTTRPWAVIVGTAALFAFFHVIVGGMLAVERLPPSFLLGLVLGWMCWQTGSVIPGIILHALHNSLLVLLAYYEPMIAERGWMPSAEDHLPGVMLLSAAIGAVLGMLWLGWQRRPQE